jgi:hypothetical protein
VGGVMHGSAVFKDLSPPAVRPQPQMSSPGLLRYRSAPSNLLGEVCAGDFHAAAEGGAHRPADHAVDAALAGHHDEAVVGCKPPRPAPAAHFLHDAASMASHHQLMYQSQQQHTAAQMEELYYRTLSSNGAAVGSGNSPVRQSSSPAGFLKHLNTDNGNWRFLCTILCPPRSGSGKQC